MNLALKIPVTLFFFACVTTVFADPIPQLDGKKIELTPQILQIDDKKFVLIPLIPQLDGNKIELTAQCGVSKVPDSVYVLIGEKKYRVKLPREYQNKFDAGEQAWIGLTGVCRDKKIGKPGLTAEHADGFIEVEKILFYDQKKGRKSSFRVLE